jgi:hypothetical protein
MSLNLLANSYLQGQTGPPVNTSRWDRGIVARRIVNLILVGGVWLGPRVGRLNHGEQYLIPIGQKVGFAAGSVCVLYRG